MGNWVTWHSASPPTSSGISKTKRELKFYPTCRQPQGSARQCEAACHSHQDGVDSAHWEAEHINTPGLVFQDEIQSHTIMPKPPGCCRKSPIVQQTNLDEKAVDDDAEKNQMLELCDNDFKVLIITILQR